MLFSEEDDLFMRLKASLVEYLEDCLSDIKPRFCDLSSATGGPFFLS